MLLNVRKCFAESCNDPNCIHNIGGSDATIVMNQGDSAVTFLWSYSMPKDCYPNQKVEMINVSSGQDLNGLVTVDNKATVNS